MEQADAGAFRAAPVRFLAFCGEPPSLRRWLLSLVPSADRPERLNRILSCVNLVVYASPETPFVRLDDEKGVVMGGLVAPRVCRRTPDRYVIAEELYRAICSDLGSDGLPDGDYVAFVRAHGGIAVLRGPPGAVGANYSRLEGVTALFSHTALCSQLSPKVSTIHMLEAGKLHWFHEGKGGQTKCK